MKKTQISISLPEIVLTELDCHVDGVAFRSRAHIIHSLIVDWLVDNNKSGKKQTDIFEKLTKSK